MSEASEPGFGGFGVDVALEDIDLLLDLVLGGQGVHLGHRRCSLVVTAQLDEVAWGLGEEKVDGDALDDGWDRTDGDDPSPTGRDVLEGCTDGVGDDLTTCDADAVECRKATTLFCRGQFLNVHRDDAAVVVVEGGRKVLV